MPAEKAAVARRSFLNQRLSAIKIGVNQRETFFTREDLILFPADARRCPQKKPQLHADHF